MKIGIISDSHDDVDNVNKAITIFEEEKVGAIIHAGDIISPPIIKEFKRLNKNISLKQVEKALIRRDGNDTKRKISPLIKTKNAVLVDTTKLRLKEMELKLLNIVKNSIINKYGNL